MKREYPDHPLVGVGAVIVKDGAVLLVQRAHDPGRGKWAMPGGRLRLGETLAQAARREAHEETGVEIEPGEALSVTDLIQRDDAGRIRYHYVLVDLLARYVGGEPAGWTPATWTLIPCPTAPVACWRWVWPAQRRNSV